MKGGTVMRMVHSAIICLVLAAGSGAAIITVDDDGPADFNDIQAAVDAAENGDTVIVEDGTYVGPGNRGIRFQGKAITVISRNGPDRCVINCQGRGRGFWFRDDEPSTAVLEGLKIINGLESYGGGIYCYNRASPTIVNCVIQACRATYQGGGICCEYETSPTISGCLFIDNTADSRAGAVYIGNASAVISRCTIIGNSARNDGGGVYCYRGTLTVDGCTLADNWCG